MKPIYLVIATVFCLVMFLAACTSSTSQQAFAVPGNNIPPAATSDGQEITVIVGTRGDAPGDAPADTPAPFPTKDQTPPTNPVVKGADPFPGWATYLNSDYDFAFRYPDAYLVEDSPHLVRLTRPGVELLVNFRGAAESLALPHDLPYEGDTAPGAEVVFFEQGILEVRHLVNGQVMAVEYTALDSTAPEGELSGPEMYFAIQLVSQQSDVPLTEELLAETLILLSSFEPWTNN